MSACVENRRIFSTHLAIRKETSPSSNAGEGAVIARDESASWNERNVAASSQESRLASRRFRESRVLCSRTVAHFGRRQVSEISPPLNRPHS